MQSTAKQTKNITFSIVIPVYNRTQSLRDALASVKQQTYDNYECIVIDDGSQNSNELKGIVNELKDSRFKYIHQNNSGASKARNNGIEHATGDYIAFLDSDDRFVPEKLEKHLQAINKVSEKNASYFGFSRLQVDRGLDKYWVKPQKGPSDFSHFDTYLLCTHGWAQTSTQVLSSLLAKQVLFNEALPSSQDADFALRCWSAGANMVFLPEALTIMEDRFDPNRVSKQANHKPLVAWIDSMKDKHISAKAYFGYRGWQVARVASNQDRITALRYYLPSVIRGAFSPYMALNIFAQIIIPVATYQKVATKVIKMFGNKEKP